MNKYLIEILKIQNSVILPGLGALMVPSQKSGKIVFNPHLKFNDGSLARFIADKEGIEEQESQNKVAKFVREIEAEIGKGNSYDMFEFGNFFKNKDDEVDFKMYLSDAKPAAKTPKTEKVVTPPVAKKEENAKPAKEPVKKKDKKPVAKKAAENKPEATEESKQAKNKFVPPIIEDTKEDLTKKEVKVEEKVNKKTEKVEEKVKDKVEEVKENIDAKTKSTEKGIGAILHETKEKVENKIEDIKEKTTDKSAEKAVPSPVIANSKSDDKKADDKQSKNTFTPESDADKKEEESVKDKSSTKATIASGAAIVTGAAAAASSGTKTVIEKTKETTVIKETVVKEEKKKRKIWPWIILLLLLVGLAVAGYFFKDRIMSFFNDEAAIAADSTADMTADDSNILSEEFDNPIGDDMDEMDDSTMTDPTNMNDTGVDPEDGTEPVGEPIEDSVEDIAPVVSGTNNGSYHLIGNSFGEKTNAERYSKQMQDKGYPAKILGRFDGLYMVSLKSYDSRSAANNGRSSVSADAGSAWVFKYSK